MRIESLKHLDNSELQIIATNCMNSIDIHRVSGKACMQLVRLYLTVSSEIAARQLVENHRHPHQYSMQ